MIPPHGGKLITRYDPKRASYARTLPAVVVEDRYLHDCELLGNGGFSPLDGFMGEKDARAVIQRMRLSDGTLWSIPIVLPEQEGLVVGEEVALCDQGKNPVAIMLVEERYTLDLDEYARNVYQTSDEAHPGVAALQRGGEHFVAGPVTLVARPAREDIDDSYYLDPVQLREVFAERGWSTIVAFQTRNPIHRAHEYLTKCALENVDGLLIHPLVGETKPDDIPADVRMRCYETIIDSYYNKERTMLSVLPAAMRYAGPREAIHHAIMRQNYGVTHFIVGRDHAGVGDYYGTYEAQDLILSVADHLAIKPVCFEHAFFCTECESMASQKTCPHGNDSHVFLSGTKVRGMLKEGKKPPAQFTRPEVADVLLAWTQGK